jgi:hypothetical protein
VEESRLPVKYRGSVVGVLFLVLLAGAGVVIRISVSSGRWTGAATAAVVVLAAGIFGVFRALSATARRATTPTLSRLDSVLARPFTLYLRSFRDDDAFTFRRPGNLWLRAAEADLTLEELFVRALGEAGPVVAIGRPSESLPPLGATRYYSSTGAWQEEVSDLVRACHVVVMLLGASPGFLWELRRVASLGRLRSAVLVLPRLPAAERAARWDGLLQALDGFDLRLPAAPPRDAVAMTIKTGGAPAWIRVSADLDSGDDYRDACVAALRHLAPVLLARGAGDASDEDLEAEFDLGKPSGVREAKRRLLRPDSGFEPPGDGFEPPREWSGE